MSRHLSRLPRSVWLAAFLVPLLLAMLCCFLLQPQPASLAAPFWGPWAGYLLDHADCTAASFWRRGSMALAIAGPILFVSRQRVGDEALRGALSVLLVLWLCLWYAFAVLSVVNTTS